VPGLISKPIKFRSAAFKVPTVGVICKPVTAVKVAVLLVALRSKPIPSAVALKAIVVGSSKVVVSTISVQSIVSVVISPPEIQEAELQTTSARVAVPVPLMFQSASCKIKLEPEVAPIVIVPPAVLPMVVLAVPLELIKVVPKIVVEPLMALVPVELPMVLAAAEPVPKVLVKLAPVAKVVLPEEVSVVNDPAPPLIPAVQVKAPVELVTVQPLAPLPPAKRTSPVEDAPILIVPAFLASIVKFSSVPEDMVVKASPPPAAAAVTFKPVALEAVLVSTCRA